ncbi:MAG TPA: GatB/YqeY domain-containing protein [Patescibacteria group bacterium]|nr:GatB/YqeY domain-containing protein [Patescibacteria group bacterium]
MGNPLLERLEQEFKEAMKAKDESTLSTLRLMRTSLKNKQIEVQHELTEPEVSAVLKTMIKQYQDALADFTAAGRQDLVERQQREIDIIASYLPPALPPEELEKIVKEAIESSGVTEVGKAMGIAMKAVNGRADGNAVRLIVQRLLSR